MIEKGNSPLVAVYMITYNHEKYIDQAISSVMDQQTTFTFQLFIGDDSSSDKTASICLEWAKKYPEKIVFLDTKINLGIYRNASRVLDACLQSGAKYIALLEGDDYWCDVTKLQKQIDLLESDDRIAGSYHQTEFLFNSGERKVIYKKLELRKNLSSLIGEYSPFHTSSFVFRTKHFCRPSWFEKIDSIDLAMYTWHGQFGDMVGFPETMSVYRIHGAGLTASAEHNDKFHQKRVTQYQMLQGKINPPFLDRFDHVLRLHRKNLKGRIQNQFPTAMIVSKGEDTHHWKRWMFMGLNAQIISVSVEDSKLNMHGLSMVKLNQWKWWNGHKMKRVLRRKDLQFPSLVVFENKMVQVQFENFFSSFDIPMISLEDLPLEIKGISDDNQRGNHFASWINAHFLPLKA